MNIKYLMPFIESAYEVILAEAKIEMKRGELTIEKGAYVTGDITVILSLIGDIKGTVIYSLEKITALNIVSKIFGETLREFDDLAQSGVAELGNVITGKASVKLSQSGYESTISPPALIVGNGARVSTLAIPRLRVPLQSEAGEIVIHLALMESSAGGIKTADLSVPPKPETS
jgi:chemotaxis protein CheX